MENIKVNNYLIGGRLGDFIHSLVVPKFLYDQEGIKANIFITDIGDIFSNGLQNTYNELLPVMQSQRYVELFSIYNNEPIDYRLCDFRNSHYLYTTCWNEVFFKTFIPKYQVPSEFSWLDVTTKDYDNDTIVINRSTRRDMNNIILSEYNNIFEEYHGHKFIFICSDKSQYDSFPLKNKTELKICTTIEEIINAIYSAKIFVGNQSTPYAIASALNKPRILEALDSVDRNHYITDSKYYKNTQWFQGA